MRKLILPIAALTLLCAGATFAQEAGDGLPSGPGHDTFVRTCTGCHDPSLVTARHLDRAGWDETVQKMMDLGATANDAEAREIVDYLTAHYPAK